MEKFREDLRKLGFSENKIDDIIKLYENEEKFIVSEDPEKWTNFSKFSFPLIRPLGFNINKDEMKHDLLKDVYGPGDDDYGRNPPPWKKTDMKIKMEVCSCCGKQTDIPISQHIDLRENYVEGAGQLCGECYNKLYDKLP